MYNLSRKSMQKFHINQATETEVRNWQAYWKQRLGFLESQGYTIIAIDEAFFHWGALPGKKYWSPIGTRIYMPYIESHEYFRIRGHSKGRQ